MVPFLKQVAAHYFAAPDIRHTVFIFPNRRSMVFFRKYLGEEVRHAPVLAPVMFTINDFFYRVYDVDVTERNRLLVELYGCYKSLYPKAEPLDEFLFGVMSSCRISTMWTNTWWTRRVCSPMWLISRDFRTASPI